MEKTNMFLIVEFNDGIFAVPTVWLNTDKKSCKWPPYDERKILKAISKREEPDKNWKVLSVTQIFGTAPDYDNAMKKVSLAEQLTDISDIENAKKTRKSRARRVLSSDDSDEESKKKSKKTENTAKKAIESMTYPEFSSTSNITKSSFSSIDNNDNVILTKRDADITIVEKNDSVKTPYIKDVSTGIDHTFLTTNEKIDYLIELQKLSIKKENIIFTKINDIQKRINDLDKSSGRSNDNKVDNDEHDEHDIVNLFPIKNTEQLKSLEEKLKNKNFY